MNEHEIERIAAAMNQLRPDWPAKQLRTLLADARIADRPRRDVAVALAWVACESGTANPYRVIEAGPWWRAAAIEGQAHQREVLSREERCGICAKPRERCQSTRLADDDHEFEPDYRPERDTDTAATVAALRELKRAAGQSEQEVA